MTFAEILLTACLGMVLYALLSPLRRYLERALRRFLGARNARIIDVTIIRSKKTDL